jgi:hypothetical protein
MKRLFTLLAIVLFTIGVFAQAPQRISYQAVVRNSSNALVASTPIGMQISILQGSDTGPALYVETHTPTTNVNGLVTIEIGGGTVVSGSLGAIDLKSGPFFVKSEIAVTAPLTTYTITGTSQLLSVPYAMYAESVGNYTETDPAVKAITGIVKSDGTTLSAAVPGTDYLLPNGSAASLTGFPTLNQNTTGSAASFTGSLAGEVSGPQGATVIDNSAVLGKVLTTYTSGAGTIVPGDNILQAIQKLNGNDAILPALSGEATSVGNAVTLSNAAVIGKVLTTYTSGAGTVVPGDNILEAIQKLNGNDATNANLTGEVTSVGNAATVTNAAVLGKVLTGYISGAGTIVPGDNILQAIQKLNGNDATNANLSGMVTSVGNLTTVVTNANLTGMVTSVGNATTVVTNANLTGDVTSTGNATVLAGKTAMTATLPLSVTGTPSVVATGPVAISIAPATITTAGSMSATDKVKLDGLTATTHYLGEQLDGGVIFEIYTVAGGAQHGLIVALTEQAATAWQTVTDGTSAISTWNGAANTAALLVDPNPSPAAVYAASLGAGWYLPSIDELSILWHNRFYVDKALSTIGGSMPLGSLNLTPSDYWSSTEYDGTTAFDFYFYDGKVYNGLKTAVITARAIRAF